MRYLHLLFFNAHSCAVGLLELLNLISERQKP